MTAPSAASGAAGGAPGGALVREPGGPPPPRARGLHHAAAAPVRPGGPAGRHGGGQGARAGGAGVPQGRHDGVPPRHAGLARRRDEGMLKSRAPHRDESDLLHRRHRSAAARHDMLRGASLEAAPDACLPEGAGSHGMLHTRNARKNSRTWETVFRLYAASGMWTVAIPSLGHMWNETALPPVCNLGRCWPSEGCTLPTLISGPCAGPRRRAVRQLACQASKTPRKQSCKTFQIQVV
mmetsp:Transcript_9818/g.24996  ORF Transcript_9818/g.24996 Transcript_9818/m.24996 type:complete len:237 (+) Transcript_9818:79-789(+)